MPTLFRKTAKGQAEIETRAHRLTPRLRGLLILVDGKRDLAGLAALMPQGAEALLQELTAQGFIEAFESAAAPAAAAVARAPAPAPAPAPAAPASPAADFEKLRREAVRAFTDIAGPAAETVAIRMEKARSADELRPLLAQAAQVLANMRGRAAAEAYAQRFPSS
jgi:hypothetical protein